MGKFTFDDDDNGQEPSFSLHDFKRWLNQQRKNEKPLDIVQETKTEESKDKLKDEFKERLHKRKKKD